MSTSTVSTLVLLATLLWTACGITPEQPVDAGTMPHVRIVHGWGDDSPYSASLQQALGRSMTGITVDVRGTSTTVTNVFTLERGDADAVFTFADVAYMASVGQLPGMPQPFDGIRAIAELPTRALQVVVGRDSSIHSLADLRHRHVSLGPPGSGSALTSAFVLTAFGISLDDLEAERLPFSAGAKKVIAGEIDAAFWNGTFPNANISSATARGARLLEVTGPDIDRFRTEYPFLKPSVIPAGTYAGVPGATHTVGIDGILVCRADLDEATVHELTRALFDILGHANLGVQALEHMNLNWAASTAIPLHPGAARYYRERELLR